jgi:hypothetical protein
MARNLLYSSSGKAETDESLMPPDTRIYNRGNRPHTKEIF